MTVGLAKETYINNLTCTRMFLKLCFELHIAYSCFHDITVLPVASIMRGASLLKSLTKSKARRVSPFCSNHSQTDSAGQRVTSSNKCSSRTSETDAYLHRISQYSG